MESPLHHRGLIRYESKWRALICLLCRHALPKKSMERHLWDRHELPAAERRAVVSAFVDHPAIESKEEFPVPPDGSEPVVGLRVSDGYQCRHCRAFSSKNRTAVERHGRARHPELRDGGTAADVVSLQQWFPTHPVAY